MVCRENLGLVWKTKTLLIAPICPQAFQTTTKGLHSPMRFRCHRKSIHVWIAPWNEHTRLPYFGHRFHFDAFSTFHSNMFPSDPLSNRCVFKQKRISVARASESVFSSDGKFWDARELETPDRPPGLIFRKETSQKHTNTNPSGKFFNLSEITKLFQRLPD